MLTQEDYRIGWICALHLELTATEDDENTYVLGGIGQHNIVIACLPAGVYGTTSATAVALQMRASFTAMRFCLMVGIGGGAPTPEADIRLGDVVVSKPTAGYGGVFQYDYGKAVAGGEFLATGSLDKPPAVLLTAISRIQARHHLHGNNIRGIYEEVLGKYKALAGTFVYLGKNNDLSFRLGMTMSSRWRLIVDRAIRICLWFGDRDRMISHGFSMD